MGTDGILVSIRGRMANKVFKLTTHERKQVNGEGVKGKQKKE